MTIYWLSFLVVASLSLSTRKSLSDSSSKNISLYLGMILFCLFVFQGLRFEVGGDWLGYLKFIDFLSSASFTYVLTHDPGYTLFAWLGANLGGGVFVPNLVSSAILMLGLRKFCLQFSNPMLALLVAMTYLVWIVGGGYVRQAAAIGCILMALSCVRSADIRSYIIYSVIATLFHKTSIIALPLAVLLIPSRKVNGVTLVVSGLVCFVVLAAIFRQQFDAFGALSVYFTDQMNSRGAEARIFLTGICSVSFLFLRNRFDLNIVERRVWSTYAFCGLLLLIFFLASSMSTLTDRLNLYWLPFQIFFLSNLPFLFKVDRGNSRLLVTLSVVMFAAVLQWTWLNYADHAEYWVPYRFFPWEFVWGDI